ncbi:ParA family protein [Aphanizomenon flos-aquae NRERC-008]|jgi:cellulose biosynthesis protein BcsQ|uniref:Cobyrinic acid a,c-diamide synthase n=3 Tax=Aphanizomenon flos-aquae TaxID=1176 RepID=A0A1B7X4M7_APHFL|nr:MULTISPECIES: ParA family protein [Aphanizomenon]MBD1215969.1 ParA family protein [Aphanizomenon flos-aquae Clear-A1]MBO1043693.1 ParA family protein [Aphanizomenon flos-aquae UKL13-PB]MBO1059844.1 ParA family protein [Aphanizomenon flos-aquae CP01]MCE2904796.1 ParA family protein [Anabaena sp. CoA2_C59]MDJ0506736.1 ParA family protein [Nostocales cyanobacterium LE14-WE12]NTW20635.1 ParA family protein [Nostocales cyanobacterium W4_Combined_metabat2_030]OBQ24016.1 MAG: cobyrinic acid a,c-
MGYVIATANMKGGVGKTTITVNMATCLAKNHGKKVLVLDLDSQISATLSLMSPLDFTKRRKQKKTLRYLLDQLINPRPEAKFTIYDIIQPQVCNLPGLNLLPGDIDLYDEFVVSEMLHNQSIALGEQDFETIWNRFERVLIRDILKPVRDQYDFILLDCAPGYNLMTRSALATSDFYILPARPEPLSVVGIQLLERRISQLKEGHEQEAKIDIKMLGIVFSMSNVNLLNGRYYKQVMHRVVEDFGVDKICKAQIPIDVNVAKAVDSFMPVSLLNPNTAGSKAFTQLTQELLQKL